MSLWSRTKPVLALIALVAAGVYLAWDLWRAAAIGVIGGRHARDIALSADAGGFWVSVAFHLLGAIVVWGAVALCLWTVVRRPAQDRKLDAWLRRRGANQLSPPPVRRPRSP